MLNRREFTFSFLAGLRALAWQSGRSPDVPRVNGERLNEHLTSLAHLRKTAAGGTGRVAYSEADLRARDFVMRLMREAPLDVSIDFAGNIIGRRIGSDLTLKPLMIGSHIDSVPDGGNFDGQVGSMGAIEVAQTIEENRIGLRHTLEVAIFQNEEGGTAGRAANGRGLTGEELA